MNPLDPARQPDESFEVYKARRKIINKYRPPVTYIHQHEVRHERNEETDEVTTYLIKSTYVKD